MAKRVKKKNYWEYYAAREAKYLLQSTVVWGTKMAIKYI